MPHSHSAAISACEEGVVAAISACEEGSDEYCSCIDPCEYFILEDSDEEQEEEEENILNAAFSAFDVAAGESARSTGVISFNAAISACEKGVQTYISQHHAGQWIPAMIPTKAVQDDSSAHISACEKGVQWQQKSLLLSMLGEYNMRERIYGQAPNNISYNSDISAAGASTLISYSAAISANEKGEQWQRALMLLHEMHEHSEMREKGLTSSVNSPSAATSAHEKDVQWQQATLLESAGNVSSPNAAISACEDVSERGVQLSDGDQLQCGHHASEKGLLATSAEQLAVPLIDEMRERGQFEYNALQCGLPGGQKDDDQLQCGHLGVQKDVISLSAANDDTTSAATSAPVKDVQWQQATLLESAGNVNSSNAAISACGVVSEKGVQLSHGDQLQCGHHASEEGLLATSNQPIIDEMREQGLSVDSALQCGQPGVQKDDDQLQCGHFGVQEDDISFSAANSVFEKGVQWKEVLDISPIMHTALGFFPVPATEEMCEQGQLTYVKSFGAAISASEPATQACEKSEQCPHTATLQGKAKKKKKGQGSKGKGCDSCLDPSLEKGQPAASQCDQLQHCHLDDEKPVQRQAVPSQSHVREKDVQMQHDTSLVSAGNVTCSSAAISACDDMSEKGVLWQQALLNSTTKREPSDDDQLQCGHRGVEDDVISCSEAISACAKDPDEGVQWQQASQPKKRKHHCSGKGNGKFHARIMHVLARHASDLKCFSSQPAMLEYIHQARIVCLCNVARSLNGRFEPYMQAIAECDARLGDAIAEFASAPAYPKLAWPIRPRVETSFD